VLTGPPTAIGGAVRTAFVLGTCACEVVSSRSGGVVCFGIPRKCDSEVLSSGMMPSENVFCGAESPAAVLRLSGGIAAVLIGSAGRV
jgi:hypothetical protein